MVSAVQSVRFDRKAGWNTTTARAWLKAHGFTPIKRVDVTKTQLRYRIRSPDEFDHYSVVRIQRRALQFVIGYYPALNVENDWE
jgi:hypothetical protein